MTFDRWMDGDHDSYVATFLYACVTLTLTAILGTAIFGSLCILLGFC